MTLYIGDKPVGLMKVVKDTKYIDKTKFGLSIDNFIGETTISQDVTVLVEPTIPEVLDGSGIVRLGGQSLCYKFFNKSRYIGPKIVRFGDVVYVFGNALYYAFAFDGIWLYEHALESIDLHSVETVETMGMGYMCLGQEKLTGHIDLGNLKKIEDSGLRGAFKKTSITSINLNNLTTVGNGGLSETFANTKLTSLSFPALTSVDTKAFAGGFLSSADMLYQCTTITEIHFRADMQATIEATTGYSRRFGAPSTCTIYFDL